MRSPDSIQGLHGSGAPPRERARGPESAPPGPVGGFATIEGEAYYRIHAFDQLPPFLMNLPTDTDLWMFVSSTGGLTAGRRDPDGAIFPYETVDRLHDGHHHTGPVTLVRVPRAGHAPVLWEPFAPLDDPGHGIVRSLAKNTIGNRLCFEEVREDLGLSFRSRWAGSDPTGWVRSCTLANLGRAPITVALLDGLRNLLPGAVPLHLTQQSSCLVDAYKRADVDRETGLATFSLTARVSDGPEPAEVLRANTAWCHGLVAPVVALSRDALRAFRRGEPVLAESVRTGRRGNYLVTSTVTIPAGGTIEWHIAADAARSHVQVAQLRAQLQHRADLGLWIEDSLRRASANLERIVGSADGIQLTGRADVSVHHFANVLFNSLRGGVFVQNHDIPAADLASFVRARNRIVADRHAGFLTALPADLEVVGLHRLTEATGDADLRRLGLEYLPLYFGRRHGDPSRPWNRFSISVRDRDGRQALHYEGNWRDIFQNWEALTRSFPEFIPGVIAKFLNASTVDGFNPYRITQDGIDWEVLDPADPWSGIGYWGDHQIVYLLRLLESMRSHLPGGLEALLAQEIFSYADVPYRLRPYREMLRWPRATIRFDEAHAACVAERMARLGDDGKLVPAEDGTIRHVSLLEKLLVPALAKLSSLVPDGGIWMNTQRPEWNDANNALVGSGLSVVTLCHLRRYLKFLEGILGGSAPAEAPVSLEVVSWLREVTDALARHHDVLGSARLDDGTRRRLMDELGQAFSSYRERVYGPRVAATVPLAAREVIAWCRLACDHLDHAIRANRRDDGLYHSYQILETDPDGTRASVRPLGVMLEGQVAALASGLVPAAEVAPLLDALYASALYRPDQDSFLLYPDRELPPFLERNRIPEAAALAVPLVRELLAAGDDTVLERDADGVLRFQGDLGNAHDLDAALDRLALRPAWTASVGRDRPALLALFVEVFEHRTFTGRSGRMYAYEGLGSIYWHMVAKLLLAVQEIALEAGDRGEPAAVREALARGYHRVRKGLGFEKSVREYGAFPSDPYSHTPAHAGAQQPGMTGQVKEEILTRFGEFGVRVEAGRVRFAPVLLRRDEFLSQPARYRYHDLDGAERTIELAAGTLAFTHCQVPVVYRLVEGDGWIRVTAADGATAERPGDRLDAEASLGLLSRSGAVRLIEVGVPEPALCAPGASGRA